jgi:stage V sporulation protein G
MEVTKVEVRLSKTADRLLATASIILDNELAIHEIRVVRRNGSGMIAMPSRKATVQCPCGERMSFDCSYCPACAKRNAQPKPSTRLHNDIAHPISAGLRKRIEDSVLAAYQRRLGDGAK